jgi:2-iminobutanoate/2-iminopropanoate deaminase
VGYVYSNFAGRNAIVGVTATDAPLSSGLRVGDIVFISGQVPVDPATSRLVQGDIQRQTRQVLDNISVLLSKADCRLSDIVKTTVFLSDIDDFAAMNQVYREYFPNRPPTRSTFEAKLAVNARVEIEAIAIRCRDGERPQALTF